MNWAVYYTACALKACLDEEEKENDDRPLLPDRPNPGRYAFPPEAYEYLARFGWLMGASENYFISKKYF